MLKNDKTLSFMLACSFMQIISTISTSFIEEEHMIWYFVWTSWLVVAMVVTNVTKKESISLFVLLIMSRIVRKLNQTGDQWASLPDISDWLIESHHKLYLSFFFLGGTLLFFSS